LAQAISAQGCCSGRRCRWLPGPLPMEETAGAGSSECPAQSGADSSDVDTARARGASSEEPPPSPLHESVWLSEPASIDEPLLLLDEGEGAGREHSVEAELSELRAALAEARGKNKADRAALESLTISTEALEQERETLRSQQRRLEQENGVLRLQLQNHHGIMAADWEQTLSFQERLRDEEAAHAQLAAEVTSLRRDIALRNEEAALLRKDAGRWRFLSGADIPADLSSRELESVLQVTLEAVARLHAESIARSQSTKVRLHEELEHQLCVVCRDAKKSVLFKPCHHVCVCDGCRGRLRPYRCPICQVPVQSHLSRVHL